jgi:hypothetical protein
MTAPGLKWFCFALGIAGALLAGCTQPNPNTSAGSSDIAGQQCTLCIAENPGIAMRATQFAFDAWRTNPLI